MSEPLDEGAETSWMEYLNRFDNEIYPTLFADRGIPKEVAHMIWSNNLLRSDISELIDLLKEIHG